MRKPEPGKCGDNSKAGLTNWDLSVLLALDEGDSPATFALRLGQDYQKLEQRFARLARQFDEPDEQELLTALIEFENLEERYLQYDSYAMCMVGAGRHPQTADEIRNTVSQLRSAALLAVQHARSLLSRLSDEPFKRLLKVPALASAGHYLRILRRDGRLRMSDSEEELLIALEQSGLAAWSRMYSRIMSELTFEMPGDSGNDIPISDLYALLSSPDPEVRKGAYWSSSRAYEAHQIPLAASLNGIAGSRMVAWRRRGFENFLDAPIQQEDVQRRTVEQMMEVVAENRSFPQDWLRLKAKILGFDRLGLYDRSAALPVPEAEPLSLSDAIDLIVEAFSSVHPPMAAFVTRAFESHWVQTKTGKGNAFLGFCCSFPRSGKSGVFAPYHGNFNTLSALVHELGHAYHGEVRYRSRYWAQQASSILHETAALAAEHMFRHHILYHSKPTASMKTFVLGIQLDTAVNYLLRIPRDFEFECALYAEREDGELSVDRLKELMSSGYQRWFGDSLAGDGPGSDRLRADGMDRMGWASKPHFFMDNAAFYNFPYTVGYLLAAAIAERFLQDGADFQPRYDAFLELTGRMSVEDAVYQGLDIDLSKPDFWQHTIDGLKRSLEQMSELAQASEPAR